jgi:hypothetical protein
MVPVRETTRKTTKRQAGDPHFLERVAWCVECRLKLMGLFKNQTNIIHSGINWDVVATTMPPPGVEIKDEVEKGPRPGR